MTDTTTKAWLISKFDGETYTAAAKTTDDVMSIHDKAEAMRAYARIAEDLELELDAIEIRKRRCAMGGCEPRGSAMIAPMLTAQSNTAARGDLLLTIREERRFR